ncbi:hypothetical protein GALMADRAFT_157357 [Galerina marginata CBS 339.88]|uniref:DUF6534 domain-containing protein n=1 Tax=Galerina marginata (strain CBS 339.88) TaxID=685588 RepID=A0A067SXI4_GALM3|nr:hypothetical protein GALMADRAFT_157357 [Galerina marginata CBS 339.88]
MVAAVKTSSFILLLAHWKWLITTLFTISSTVDIIVTMNLAYYLLKSRKPNSQKNSLIIDKVIAWTIQSGLVSSLTGLGMLICFLAMPNNYIWLSIFLFLSRIFSTSLLASLNGRMILPDQPETSFLTLSEPTQASKYGNDLGQVPANLSQSIAKLTEAKGEVESFELGHG